MEDRFNLSNFLAFILITLCATGCSSSSDPTTVYLDGYVSGAHDVSGAHLQVTDKRGNVLAEKAPSTSDTGAFMITVKDLPHEFRVVSTGGTESGESVGYRLQALFSGFNSSTDMIYINLATTLVCAYRDRNADKTLAEATAAVKTFLDIPDEVDTGEGLYHNSKYFNPSKFMVQAAANGGVDAFIQILVDEMSQGSGARHPFVASSTMGGDAGEVVATCAGTSMAQAARNGAIAWGAGFALNMGMQQLFPSTAGPTKADIQRMEEMLTQIKAQIIQLGNEVAVAKAEIKSEIIKSEYNIGSMQLSDYVTLIVNTFNDLENEIQKDPTTLTEAEKAARLSTINAKLKIVADKIEPYLGSLHKKLHGDETLDADGLYKVYADKLKTGRRFLSKANYQDKVKKLFLYYNQIEATELYLAVEYYRAGYSVGSLIQPPQSKTIIDTHTAQLGTNSQAELDWINSVEPIASQIILDGDQGLMIYAGEKCYGTKLCPEYVRAHASVRSLEEKNAGNYFGHNDWWFPRDDQVSSFFKSCGSLGYDDLSECLNSQGWPWPSKYTYILALSNGDRNIFDQYKVFGLEAHAWYYFGTLQDSGPWHIVAVRGGAAQAIW